MATHSSVLAWEIPWTPKPGGLQSMGLQRVEHDWTTGHTRTSLSFHSSEGFCPTHCTHLSTQVLSVYQVSSYNEKLPSIHVVVAEWLRRWTRNPLGSPRAGSNPADYELVFLLFFSIIKFLPGRIYLQLQGIFLKILNTLSDLLQITSKQSSHRPWRSHILWVRKKNQ